MSGAGVQREYQRVRGSLGHSARGRSRMVVSAIENGAGSVAVLARPTLPSTLATSGNWLSVWSILRSCTAASPADTPGNVVGMKSRSPSSTRGGKQETIANAAVSRVKAGRARAKCTNGR